MVVGLRPVVAASGAGIVASITEGLPARKPTPRLNTFSYREAAAEGTVSIPLSGIRTIPAVGSPVTTRCALNPIPTVSVPAGVAEPPMIAAKRPSPAVWKSPVRDRIAARAVIRVIEQYGLGEPVEAPPEPSPTRIGEGGHDHSQPVAHGRRAKKITHGSKQRESRIRRNGAPVDTPGVIGRHVHNLRIAGV